MRRVALAWWVAFCLWRAARNDERRLVWMRRAAQTEKRIRRQ